MNTTHNMTNSRLMLLCGTTALSASGALAMVDRISEVVPNRIVTHNEQGGLRRIIDTTAGGVSCHGNGAWFTPVGGAGISGFGSVVTGISPDGMVAVGWSLSLTDQGGGGFVPTSFAWTPCDGAASLSDVPGAVGGQALAVSVGGEVVVGVSHAATDTGYRRFAANGVDAMIDESTLFGTTLRAVSADGRVVVGSGTDMLGQQAMLFVDGWDHVRSIGDLTGGDAWSDAYGVSADGAIVVGQSFSAEGPQAFAWSNDMGIIGLGDLAGGEYNSSALAASSDGSVIVGVAWSQFGPEAFRWTAETGMMPLGDLPGGGFGSEALAVSSDGRIIVGRSLTAHGYEAFYWTQAGGMRTLRSVIYSRITTDIEIPLLTSANGISADGTIIGGSAINEEGIAQGWIARLPLPMCMADWNQDGVGNSTDYFAFLEAFFSQNADFNGDGTTDTGDFFAFLVAFFQGC